MILVSKMCETNIKVLLNEYEPITISKRIIPLIDVLKIQFEDDEEGDMTSSELIIPYPEATLNMFTVILTALEEYLIDEEKRSDYPQPIPEDKTFGEIIKYKWEKNLLTWINDSNEKLNDRIEIVFKMTIFADYLGCEVIKNYFCVYIASWIRRNKFDVIEEMGDVIRRSVE